MYWCFIYRSDAQRGYRGRGDMAQYLGCGNQCGRSMCSKTRFWGEGDWVDW